VKYNNKISTAASTLLLTLSLPIVQAASVLPRIPPPSGPFISSQAFYQMSSTDVWLGASTQQHTQVTEASFFEKKASQDQRNNDRLYPHKEKFDDD